MRAVQVSVILSRLAADIATHLSVTESDSRNMAENATLELGLGVCYMVVSFGARMWRLVYMTDTYLNCGDILIAIDRNRTHR